MLRFGLSIAIGLAITACAPAPSKTGTEERWPHASGKPLPRKIVLLPAYIRMYELPALGAIDEMEASSNAASENADSYIRDQKIGASFDLIDSATLDAEADRQVRQYVALYGRIVQNAYMEAHSRFPDWRERSGSFDYTLGPGLQALADRTGGDAALLVSGTAYVPTPTHTALMALTRAVGSSVPSRNDPLGLSSPSMPCQMRNDGGAIVSIGIVDLHTGDVLWSRSIQRCATDPQGLVQELIWTVPQPSGSRAGSAR